MRTVSCIGVMIAGLVSTVFWGYLLADTLYIHFRWHMPVLAMCFPSVMVLISASAVWVACASLVRHNAGVAK